jgi:hypothetical protein
LTAAKNVKKAADEKLNKAAEADAKSKYDASKKDYDTKKSKYDTDKGLLLELEELEFAGTLASAGRATELANLRNTFKVTEKEFKDIEATFSVKERENNEKAFAQATSLLKQATEKKNTNKSEMTK